MSFQGYIDTIRAKTGKEPKDFLVLARGKGLAGPDVKAGDVVSWLAADFGLGRGHAMAIYAIIKDDAAPRPSSEDRVSRLFGGPRQRWRPAFNEVSALVRTFGHDGPSTPQTRT